MYAVDAGGIMELTHKDLFKIEVGVVGYEDTTWFYRRRLLTKIYTKSTISMILGKFAYTDTYP
jgi:hypothetical protein